MATRRESVRLSLIDDFTPGMAKAAAVTALLNRELNNLSGNSVKADRSTQVFVRDLGNLNREARGADRSINQLTGRLRLFADAAAIFGPGTVPVGGVLAAGVAGFASQLGFAAVAGGVLAGSMQGLGDALGAMNKAQLDPTNKNLEAAEEALKRLSPATRDFAEQLFDLKPALVAIRDMGAESLVPGLSEAFDSLERLGPQVAQIFQTVAGAMGEIAADGAQSLASDRWADFFEMIEAEAPQALSEMASALGDITHGLAEMWEAFAPLNADFSGWLVGVADGFDRWATGLSATEGFTEFVDYIRTTGPQVAETTGALANAIVQIVQASAPLGGPVLAAVEGFAKAIGAIADSDLGTPIMAGVAALALLNRSLAVTAALSKTTLSGGIFAGVGTASKGIKGQAGSLRADIAAMSDSLVAFGANTEKAGQAADRMKKRLAGGAGLVGLGVAATGAADGIGLTNTASLGLMGTLGGPPGVAIGLAAGALLDLKAAGQEANVALSSLGSVAQTGDIDALRETIARAKGELDDMSDHRWLDIGDGVAWLTGQFGDAEKKISAAEEALREMEQAEGIAAAEARGAALAFLEQTGANVDLGEWSGKSTEAIKAQADAILATREEANKTAQAFVGLGDSLNKSNVSLNQWIRDMASTADALNNFTENSIRAGKRGLEYGLIQQLQAAGKEGALRMRQLANGTQEQIDRANAAFRKGEQAIERYNNYKVPPKKVEADTSRAMQSFREVDTYLSNLNGRTATTYVNTVRTITGPQGAAVFGQRADGGTIPGPRYPYGDKMLYMLAPGEEVISNRHGQADKHRPLLKAINGGLANGGTAGRRKRGRGRFDLGGDSGPSAQEQQQAAEAEEAFYAERDRAQREAERRAEHESKMFLAAIEGQERAAQGLIDAAQTQKQAAEQVRDEWAQAMERAGSAATAGFRSDLFGDQRRGLWTGGSGGGTGVSWLDALTGDISGLEQRQGLIAQLSGQGITGSALEALFAQGSNSQIQGLIDSGRAAEFAAMFAQREALLGSTSQMMGQAAYGVEYAAASAAVAAVDARIQFLEAQLAAISGQRPINVYEAYSAQATAAEVARQQAMQGAA